MKDNRVTNIFSRFSLVYGVLFSLVGLIVGICVSYGTVSEDYKNFYVYSTIAGFLCAWVVSYFINQKPNKYSRGQLLYTAVIVGLLCHWLCWYMIALELNVRYYVLGEHFIEPPLNVLYSFVGVLVYCLWSWVFAGWATILGALVTIYLANMIRMKSFNQQS